MLATQASNSATDAKICTDKKMPKYRTADVEDVAWTMKPIAPVVAASAQKGPLILKRSERKHNVMITKKQRRYGGAERPLDCALPKVPICEMMVGTNSGKDANETLLVSMSAIAAVHA